MKNKNKEEKTRLTLWIYPETKKQARMLAAIANTTISQLFENLVKGSKKGAKHDR